MKTYISTFLQIILFDHCFTRLGLRITLLHLAFLIQHVLGGGVGISPHLLLQMIALVFPMTTSYTAVCYHSQPFYSCTVTSLPVYYHYKQLQLPHPAKENSTVSGNVSVAVETRLRHATWSSTSGLTAASPKGQTGHSYLCLVQRGILQ